MTAVVPLHPTPHPEPWPEDPRLDPELLARNRDRLPLDRIVTHTMALEDAEEALQVAQADGAMKVLLAPGAPPRAGRPSDR